MMRRSAALVTSRLARLVPVVLLAAGAAAVPAAGAAGMTGPSGTGPGTAASTLRGTWRILPPAPVSSLPPSWAVSRVWTGRQMIVHYALLGSTQAQTKGVTFTFRPADSAWARLPAGPKPLAANGGDFAAWTGSRMLVYGLTAGAYSTATNTWRAIARPGRPPSQIGGWTGHRLVIWDGVCCEVMVNTAEIYNPVTDSWRTSTSPLEKRWGAMGAWTGRQLVVFGGFSGFTGEGKVFRDGAAYNPATNTWRRLPPMPQRRGGGTAVWDGREVLFLGGTSPQSGQPSLRGMAFNPVTSSWRLLPVMQYRRAGFAAVWTGRDVLVWGGLSGHPGAWVVPPHGEAYNPAANRWSALPKSPLQGREVAVAVWTDRRLIIWGGYIPGRGGAPVRTFLNGAAFTPRLSR